MPSLLLYTDLCVCSYVGRLLQYCVVSFVFSLDSFPLCLVLGGKGPPPGGSWLRHGLIRMRILILKKKINSLLRGYSAQCCQYWESFYCSFGIIHFKAALYLLITIYWLPCTLSNAIFDSSASDSSASGISVSVFSAYLSLQRDCQQDW